MLAYRFETASNRFPRIPTLLFVALAALLLGAPAVAHAFPVPNLPEDNLIVNPWFRDADNPNAAGLDGWTRVLTDGIGWVLSQKVSNPAPDTIVSGRCGNDTTSCGTAARWAKIVSGEHRGTTFTNIDVYLYQVVETDASHRRLKFFTHWVSHRVAEADVSIYGSQTADGPWTLVWVPFFHTQDELVIPSSGRVVDLWEETGFLETTLDEGYRFYKVELRARLPEGGNVGFKVTGVYFATEFTEETADSTDIPSETATPVSGPSESASVTPLPRTSPESTSLPSGGTEAGGAESTPMVGSGDANTDRESRRPPVTTLKAVAVSPAEIQITWSANENNSRGFYVERSLNGLGDWARLARVGPQETAYTDLELEPDTLAYYRLRISSNATSNVASATTLQLSSPSPFASATAAAQLAAEPGSASDETDMTAVDTPVSTRQDSFMNPSPLFLLLAAVPAIAVFVLIALRLKRPNDIQP